MHDYQWEAMLESPASDIVVAVAEAQGIDPSELDYSLQEYVDLEAVNELADHDAASWTLSFELPDHNVTITSDGLILVDSAQIETWA